MGLIDTLFCNLDEKEPIPCEKQYSSINRRDNKGRTALFVAVAFNNKQAVETLLHLGANPHIPDVYG
jgi:ankyrin repeat protein